MSNKWFYVLTTINWDFSNPLGINDVSPLNIRNMLFLSVVNIKLFSWQMLQNSGIHIGQTLIIDLLLKLPSPCIITGSFLHGDRYFRRGRHTIPLSQCHYQFERQALHVPCKRGLKRPQSTKLQTNGLYFKIIRSYKVYHINRAN